MTLSGWEGNHAQAWRKVLALQADCLYTGIRPQVTLSQPPTQHSVTSMGELYLYLLTEPRFHVRLYAVPLKCGKLATKYPLLYGKFFLQCKASEPETIAQQTVRQLGSDVDIARLAGRRASTLTAALHCTTSTNCAVYCLRSTKPQETGTCTEQLTGRSNSQPMED